MILKRRDGERGLRLCGDPTLLSLGLRDRRRLFEVEERRVEDERREDDENTDAVSATEPP